MRYCVTMSRVVHKAAQMTFEAADEDAAKRMADWMDKRGQAPWRDIAVSSPEHSVDPIPDDAA